VRAAFERGEDRVGLRHGAGAEGERPAACIDTQNKRGVAVATAQHKLAIDCAKFASLGQSAKLGGPM
jgi:hypothetical protein